MGADNSGKVEKIEAPALQVAVKLAGTPQGAPKYSRTVKAKNGAEVQLGCPNATRALVALMNQHATDGGAACHWGGPSGLAEIMSALHGLMFARKDRPWHEDYNFVNDAGHTENGIYALRANLGFDGLTFDELKKFRSIESKLTGHGESHLNPAGVLISNGPLGSGLPQAQGLALADRALGNSRVTLCTITDGAAMEGEAKEAFAAIPGWASRGKMNPFVMVMSDNNTKLSGRIDQDAFSMIPTMEAMDDLGWKVIRVARGHDLQVVYSALEEALDTARTNAAQPVCVWVKTIKGCGVKSTVDSASGGHGFPLGKMDGKITAFVTEIYNGNPPDELRQWAETLAALKAAPKAGGGAPTDKVQSGLAKGAVRAVKEGYPVINISADLPGSTGLSLFQKTYPGRSIDAGVSESNMANAAVGAAKLGLIPIIDTFAQFGVTKGNLPLTMAALSQAPVIGVFTHTGFQDAADGASHQATTYISATASIPNTVLVSCACASEAEAFMYQGIRRIAETREKGGEGDSVLYFAGRENFPLQLVENPVYEWGKAQLLRPGKDVLIVATGPLVGQALKAADALAQKGVSAAVVNNVFVNRPDVATIGAALAAAGGKMITVEDHQAVGGMGALLCHALLQAGVAFKVRSLGIPGHFGQSAYSAAQLYKANGIDADAIVAAAATLN